MSESLRIFVVIPYFKNKEALQLLVNSLWNQTLKPEKIIFIDDGSQDPLLPSDLSPLSHFIILRNFKNKGPAYSRNKGVKFCLNQKKPPEIIAFIDSDCSALPNWLFTLSSFFKKYQKALILCGQAQIPCSTFFSHIVSMLGFPAGGNLGFRKVWKTTHIEDDLYLSTHLATSNFAIRTIFFNQYPFYFDESFTAGCEDVEYSKRLLQHNIPIYFKDSLRVNHVPIKNIFHFIQWHFKRGQSTNDLKKKKIKLFNFYQLRLWSFSHSLRQTPHLFNKMILIFIYLIQLISHFSGYWIFKFKNH